MAWTDERVERLKTLWGDGMSASQIAKDLGGVTRNAVIGKVHRLGLSSRTQTKTEEPAAAAPKVVEAPVVEEPKVVEAKPEPVAAEEPETATPAVAQPITEETPAAKDLAEIDKLAKKLSLQQLTERTCKWPVGDPARGPFYFCGHAVAPGKPYCAAHVAIAYQPMSSRRDRDRARANRQQSA